MYAICGVIFVRALRQSRLDPEVVAEPPVRRPVLALLLAGGTFTLATTAARVGLHGLSAPITMALLLTYLAVGVVLLALTVRYATLPLPSAWRPAENSALDAT
jgi:hypothetical protein